MKYALITGGATGIGRGFANGFADLGYNIILTSRSLENLAQAKKEIEQKYNNKVLIYVANLINEKERNVLLEYTKNYDVKVVVNNAGIGEANAFEQSELMKEYDLINLNIIALHHIFKHYYKIFKEKEEGRIINVSSMASFTPGPYAATYYATKAYVTSLTKAVSFEGRKANVLIQAVCPGNTKTNFHITAGTNSKYYRFNPNTVARLTIESKKTIIIPGIKNKINYILLKIFPYKLTMRVAAKMQQKQKKG